MNVFVLATCRKPELLSYTTLVFKTLRTGFPTAKVFVRNNALPDDALGVVDVCRKQVSAEWCPQTLETIHHVWIEELCQTEEEPFFICDTDMVFFDTVEDWQFDKSLAGWRIPEWFDAFTGAVTRARLHTSLLYINPKQLRADIALYHSQFPETPFNPKANLFHPLCLPFKGRGYFYDTCGMLYHAVGGQPFTDQQLDAYFHFNFGTIPDIVLPRLPKPEQDAFRLSRAALLQRPSASRGAWRAQLEYFKQHPA